ncbi:MAG: 50S ribosomal protein L1 [Victivallales bacterium]|nr:50S ribosomal protein L1 [Victivallales bacterium]MCF7889208.1 50S ribosomal protein L1 [Victivallales bacterium]
MRRSKLYREQTSKYDCHKLYSLKDAIRIVKEEMPHSKFDETIEIAFKLGIDPKKSDQNVRGAVTLPKGTGKEIKVVVIASGQAAEDAKEAGADMVGFEDIIEKIKGGWLDFDSLISTPDAMPKVRPLGRTLGPRGLMPNPKTGTVTNNVSAAVTEAKAGKVEYRADRGACAHVPVGKLSFSLEDIQENCNSVIKAILAARPSTTKGTYLISCSICSTMSPGIKVNTKEFTRRP